jgi:hypothetical protein
MIRRDWRGAAARCRPGGFTLAMVSAGLVTGLLALAGAALLEARPTGAGPAPGCVAL